MKNIRIIIGTFYGDEGKGLATDHFCGEHLDTKVLNVKHTGGAQAGHTVVQTDGTKHVFSHLGAGSFNPNVATFLAKEFICNPMIFVPEFLKLHELNRTPEVYIDSRCRITSPVEMMINQISETHLNKDRHGSCGVGVWETVMSNNRCPDPIRITDNLLEFTRKLEWLRNIYFEKRLLELGIDKIPDNYKKYIASNKIFDIYTRNFFEMQKLCTIVPFPAINELFSRFGHYVFESGQGLMLSTTNREYMPNLTASVTGLEPALDVIQSIDFDDKVHVDVCYVMRTYCTRHGAGRFDTECKQEELGVPECPTNKHNEWQKQLRYGYFDLDNAIKFIHKDVHEDNWLFINKPNSQAVGPVQINLFVTHCDETNEELLTPIKSAPIEILRSNFKDFNLDKIYTAAGPTRQDVNVL